MEELKKLYDVLVRDGYYTKSYEEFVQQYNGSDTYKDKVFAVVSRDGLFTKSKEEFLMKYQMPQNEEVEFEVKKKDTSDLELPSETSSLESQETFTKPPLIQATEEIIEGFSVTPTDTRATNYQDPTKPFLDEMSQLSMGQPGAFRAQVQRQIMESEGYRQAQAQLEADRAYTERLIEAERPSLEALQAQEKEQRAKRSAQLEVETDEVIATPEFSSAIEGTTSDYIKLEEDEAVKHFNNLYGKYGFTFRKTGIGDAMEVSTTGPDGKPQVLDIDLDPFFDSTANAEAEKLRGFVSKYARKPDEVRQEISKNDIQSSLKAKKLRPVERLNPDGTTSTVLFESAEIDGKNVVYPTLFLKNENIVHENPEYWMELEGMEAYQEALRRGEVFNFETAEEADEFAKGSWKDINNADAEGDRFFRDRGYDYLTYKKQFTEYEDARDGVDFINRRIFTLDELTPEERERFGKFYDPNTGQLRNDINDIRKQLETKEEELFSLFSDDDFQEIRDDFDVYMDGKYQELAREAARTNAAAKYVQNELEKISESTFGMSVQDLMKFEPQSEAQAKERDKIITSYKASKDTSTLAANKYEVAETFLSAKYDENLRGDVVENWSAFTNSIAEGKYRGKAGNEILKISLGLTDLDNDATTAEVAQAIVDYMEAANTGKVSLALNRYYSSKGFREGFDAFLDNPFELMTSLAANSISQMMPYGLKIIGATTGTGIATGAVAGSVVPGAGTAAGAVSGLGYGLRTGFAATNLALEYTNAWLESAGQNYNIHNPEEIAQAFDDENVWAEAKERGLKRGIPIAIIDFLSGGLAGRLFKVGKTASKGTKILAQTAERVAFDPLSEMTGEALAQITVGDELDFKEIIAEGLGGIGMNTPTALVNMAIDSRAKNNVDIANTLTTVSGLNNELKGVFAPSETRVSNWANNMERLGQINSETNQRIQLNLGLRKDANNVLDVSEGRVSDDVLNRTMELMAAKEELSSTQNRKSVFKNKIAEISAELQELAETKQLRKKEDQVSLPSVFIDTKTTSDTDIREDVRAGYSIDGISMNRKRFLKRLSDMSEKQFLKSTISITNDQEVADKLTQKFGEDAIQESETRGLFTSEQTGDIQTVEGEVRTVQPETTEPTTTQETEVERLQDNQIPVSQEKITYEDPNGETGIAKVTTQLDGSRKLQLLDEEGNVFSTETISKDNTLTNEEYVTNAAGDVKTTEEVDIETVRNPKTEERMSNRQREAAGLPVREEVAVEAEVIEEVVVPESVARPTRADVTAFYNNTIEETRLDGILAGIADKQIADKKLTKFQARVAENNQARIDEIVSSKTLQQETADFEATLEGPRVDFKAEGRFVPDIDEVTDVTAAINDLASGNVSTNLDETPSEVTIEVDELNSRTDRKLPSVKSLKVINGIPVVFTISDQLRTGNVVNPLTGTTIDNLKGGLGFTGTVGNENAAWANTTFVEASALVEKAKQIYQDNKQVFDEFWKANPEFNGHVPMPVVKMGEGSILSNEATFRVFRDNLTQIPEVNRKKALESLIGELEGRIESRRASIDSGTKSDKTINNYKKEIAGLESAISLIKAGKPKLIDDVVSTEFLTQLSLPARRKFLERLTFGDPNRAGTTKKPSKGTKSIPNILIEGMDADAVNLVHLGVITDLITEPQLKNVPQRNIIALQAVDVTLPIEESVIETTHPNYPFGVKGKTIGILENPISLVKAYPAAYKNAMEGLVAEERKGKKITAAQRKRATKAERETMPEVGELAPSSVGTILTETLGVQNGLPNLEFVGAISQGNVDNAAKLTSFMNIAFPQTNITTDQSTFEDVMSRPDVRRYKKGDQTIYGVTVDGDIYINPDVHNSESALFNTAIHEMGHVWTDYLQTTKKGKAIYAKGVELVKQTKEYERQLKRFDGNQQKAANETMAILIGNKGQTIADASLKSKFTQWLLGMWNYIKSQFKQTSNLTAEEIQDLTLDEFIGSALADIFAGKKIKLSDSQLKKMKNPEAAFSSGMSIDEIVTRGRENGFSDESIRQVLRGRGFKVRDINEAMTYQVDLFTELPPEFRRVEGGIQVAAQMFNDIKVALDRFATSGGRNIVGRRRVKSFADIRQKAQDLIQNHPTYKTQNDQVQMELRVGLDRSLGYRGGRNVSQEIATIRETLRQRKVGRENLSQLQLRLKNFIRRNLPKSQEYSQASINRLINSVTKIKREADFIAATEKVIKIVEQQRAKIKRGVIREITKEVKAKAKPRKQSGKPRPKGIDAIGQVIFSNIQTVMKAINITNPEARAQALQDIADKLEANRLVIDEASRKVSNDEEISLQEESLLQLQLAYDQFADLNTASLEVAQALLEDVKQQKRESILRFNNRRLQKAADAAAIAEEATNQIQETNPDLFVDVKKDGKTKKVLKDSDEIAESQDAIREDFTKKGIIKKVYDVLTKNILGRTKNKLTNFKNMISHLGTLTNFLDRKNKGLTIFTDKVYRKLNRMEEVYLQNMRSMRQKITDIAEEAGIKNGMDGVEAMVNKALGTNFQGVPNLKTLEVINTKTGRKYNARFNANQLLRIYALSKNDVQRAKLEKQGITDSVLADIETDLGPELISFSDKMINYLSTEYFNEINSVYKQVNGVNLGFVENYFPTKTKSPKVDAKLLQDGNFNGIFSAETAPAFKDRIDYGSDVNLKEGTFTGVLNNHLNTMERYKALAPGVQEMNQFFNIPAVDTLLEASGMGRLMKVLVNATINPQSAAEADGVGSGLLEWFQRKFTSFALAFKVIQIAKQATSFVNAFAQYSYLPKDSRVPKVLQGPLDLMMFTIDGAGVLFEMAADLVGRRGAIAKAREMSAQFDQRVREGLEGDVYGLETGSQTFKQAGKGTSLYQRGKRGFKTFSARPTIIGDIMGVMGYYINYKRNIANGMSEAEALEAFNDYNATQQTRRATEKIPLQLRGDFASKGFTMFGSTLFLQINKVMQSITNIGRSMSEGKVPKKQDIREFYLNYAVANILFVGMSNIALLTRGDDEDRDAFMRKIKDAMMGLNLAYQIPYIGAAIEQGVNRARGDRKPVSDVTNPFTSISSKIRKNLRDNPDNWFKGYVVPIIEIAMGAQVDPFIGLYNSIEEGVFGDTDSEEFYENVYDFLGITPSYRPGYGQKGSSVKGIIPQGGIRTKTDLKRYDPELYEEVYGERDRIRKEQKELRKEMLKDMGYKEVGGKLYPID